MDNDQLDQNEAVNQAGQIIGAFQKATGAPVSENALQPYDEVRAPARHACTCPGLADPALTPGAARNPLAQVLLLSTSSRHRSGVRHTSSSRHSSGVSAAPAASTAAA